MTTIIYGRFPEWPKGTDCKSVVYDFGGSNPPPSTKAKRHSERNVFFALAEGRWRIRKPALRNVPVARFNRRGFAAAKRIHHRTGRHACGSATMGGNSQSRQARAQSESQTSAPVSSLDKTGASVYNTDIRTALTCQVRSFPEQV